MILWR